MGIIDRVENWVEKRINPEEHSVEVANIAQMEIIEAYGGDERAGTWIDAYAWRFRELMNDSSLNLVERLGDTGTHADAIEEIKQKLYH